MIRDLLTLTKPGITRMVVLTAAAGFILAASHLDGVLLLHTLVGTALVAAGTNALNQWWERDVDARMWRTRNRPLPAGRLAPGPALAFGTGLAALGCVELLLFVNTLTAALALATVVSYVLVYTPLKRRTSLATIVGSVPGALPILGGWTAVRGSADIEGWVLFSILFLWQVPHFLALGWLYRDDYRRGGLRILAVEDVDGGASGRQALLYAVALVPATLLPALWGLTGGVSLVAAAGLGVLLVGSALGFALDATVRRARRLFLTTLAYLPALLAVMLLEKIAA